MKKLIWTTVQRRVNDLVPLDINPRKISEAKRMKMIESLQRFGLVDIPVIDFDGTIVSGHQRLRALQCIGQGDDLIDVRYPNRKLTTLELKEYNLLANTHFGEFDTDVFEEYFSDVDVAALGFQMDDFILPDFSTIAPEQEPVKLEAKEDDYKVPDVIVTDIVPGDLFEIGPHRLLCGDSTSADDVAKVLNGENPFLMVTDPPYGVEYDPEWRAEAGVNKNKEKMGKVKNDDRADWRDSYSLAPCSVSYIWHADRHAKTVQENIEDCGFVIRNQIIWAKDRFALSRGNYHWQHEPCWYAVKKGVNAQFIGARNNSTLWSINSREDGGHGHGTQKPVDCMARPIKNHAGDVYDPFLGSGTTMVAAHQLNRRCYGMEIDPKYCQVIIDRMLRLDPTLTITRNGQPYEPKR